MGEGPIGTSIMDPKDKFIVVFTCRFATGTETLHPFEVGYSGRGVRFVRLPCGASVHTGLILSTLEEGAEGVLLITCLEDQCHFSDGSRWAGRVMAKTSRLLKILGFPPDRVRHVRRMAGQEASDVIESFASMLGISIGSRLTVAAPDAGRGPERARP